MNRARGQLAHLRPSQRRANDDSHSGVVTRAPLAGIAFTVLATLFFASLDTNMKLVSAAVPLGVAIWFRYTFQAIATTLIAVPMRGRAVWKTGNLPFQLLRGALLIAVTLISMAALRHMPVGEFTGIVMLGPLAVTVLAATLLKERVTRARWLLVLLGLTGAMTIIRPGGTAFTWVSLLPLALVATNASFQAITSKLARTEEPLTMHLYTGWVGTIATTLALPIFWIPPAADWPWIALLLMGILGAVGHFLLILAYQRASASTVAPYLYAQIAFAMMAGWFVFGHIPDRWSLIGAATIAATGIAGAWLSVREQRRRT